MGDSGQSAGKGLSPGPGSSGQTLTQMREWGQGCPSVIISNLAKEVGYQRTVTDSKVIDVCVCVSSGAKAGVQGARGLGRREARGSAATQPQVRVLPVPESFCMGFPGGSAGNESACNTTDLGSNPGLGRSPGEGNCYPLQYSGLKNLPATQETPV